MLPLSLVLVAAFTMFRSHTPFHRLLRASIESASLKTARHGLSSMRYVPQLLSAAPSQSSKLQHPPRKLPSTSRGGTPTAVDAHPTRGILTDILHRADDGFTVAKLRCSGGPQTTGIAGVGAEVTITADPGVGLETLSRGQQLLVSGRWVRNKKYGVQLRVSSVTLEDGALKKGAAAHAASAAPSARSVLASRAIKGIGPRLANVLLTKYGDNALDVLLHAEREELLALPGIGPKTLSTIQESLAQWQSKRGALDFARSLGLSERQSNELCKVFGVGTEKEVRTNPYLLWNLSPGAPSTQPFHPALPPSPSIRPFHPALPPRRTHPYPCLLPTLPRLPP